MSHFRKRLLEIRTARQFLETPSRPAAPPMVVVGDCPTIACRCSRCRICDKPKHDRAHLPENRGRRGFGWTHDFRP